MFNVKKPFSILSIGCFISILFLQSVCYSQSTKGLNLPKRKLDIGDIKSWPSLGVSSAISKNGEYFMYEIMNQPVGSSTLVIRSTKGIWERRILGLRLGFGKVYFSGDSKQIIYQIKDSLFFLTLGSPLPYNKVILNVSNFSFSGRGAVNWLIYQSQKPNKKSTIYYLNTGKELVLSDCNAFWLSEVGESLLVKTEIDSGRGTALKFIDVDKESIATIWSDTSDCSEIVLSEDGREVAFTVYNRNINKNSNSVNNLEEKAIWYFKRGMVAAVQKVKSELLDKDFYISGNPKFAKNSNWLIFNFQKNSTIPQPEKNVVNVKVWSYKDKIILPDQIRRNNDKGGQKTFKAAINLMTNQVVEIENDSDVLGYGPFGDYAIIKGESFTDEFWWKLDPPHPTILLSLNDGKRRVLKGDNRSLENFSISPDGNWLIYFDNTDLNFFSCNLKTGKILNITKSIPTFFQNETVLEGRIAKPVFGVAAWVLEDNSLILYDNYDIWRVDPSGIRKAINITNGYGKTNRLKLRLVYSNEVQSGIRKNIISLSDTVLITGFSPRNKYNGFFKKPLSEAGNPQKLYMGPYTFYRTESQKPHYLSLSNSTQPLKADSANIWVITRENASESKNYFATDDFKVFRPLSNLYPERDYYWLTTELIDWKQLDGTMSQGILYKPENFDSTKKYPLIITYYEKMSHRLYEFPEPGFCPGDIDIPWFVTHGYLVFTPDIHYKIASKSGKTIGEWAFNSVVSAAQTLTQLPFVDKTKMGIEGHSFGAAETNFIITNTNLFAAACEFAGTSDMVSSYLTLVPFGVSFDNFPKQSVAEFDQGRMGATLWERPDLYLKQSAVLKANKITAPLLIVHNEKDDNINWRQGLELYMSLRRLGKKVWMLQYDDVHVLLKEKNAIDFTIRLTQFFDHYLKGSPAPNWLQ